MATPKVTGHQYPVTLVTPFVWNDEDDSGAELSTVATHQVTVGTLPANSRIIDVALHVDTAWANGAGTVTLDLGYWQGSPLAVVDADEFTAPGAVNIKTAGYYGDDGGVVSPTALKFTVPTAIVAEIVIATTAATAGAATVTVTYVVEGKADLVVET